MEDSDPIAAAAAQETGVSPARCTLPEVCASGATLPPADLSVALAMAEFSVDGALIQANEPYLRIFRIPRERVGALHHRDLCLPGYAASESYHAFWEALSQGGSTIGAFERRRHDGTICSLESTYLPSLDAQGQVCSILQVAVDVSGRAEREQRQQLHQQLMAMVVEASDTAVMISDAAARIVYVNAGFTRLLGWTSEEARGLPPFRLLTPEKTREERAAYRHELVVGHAVKSEEVVVDRLGQRSWVQVTSNPIFNPEGRWEHTVTMLTDITSTKLDQVVQRKALEAMARDRPLIEVLNMICEEVERLDPCIRVSILEVDPSGRLRPLSAPSLPAAYNQALDGVVIGPQCGSCGTAAWTGETVRVNDIATDPLWAPYRDLALPLGLKGCWSTPIRNHEGKVIATFAFYFCLPRRTLSERFHQRLIDACVHLCMLALEREYARRRIRQLAYYDSVTGLPNRSLVLARAAQVMVACERNAEQMALLFVDLDRFKQVNDSMGHASGDELLRHVATSLQEIVRSSDFVGRQAGDEFLVLLAPCDAEHVTQTVERIQQRLGQPVQIGGASLSVSASIGVAMYPTDGRTVEGLLHGADLAMYQAKQGGRGHFRFFSSDMNRLAQERYELERALRHALRNGLLHLHYQPQVELATGRLYGVEALARWEHPQLGPISPARFIPLAEECGLVAELGLWALEESCRQLAQWRTQGLGVPAVSVNLSATSFHNLHLPQLIGATLQRHGLQPQDLKVEITESVLLDTHPSTMHTIEAVHALGVRLSMDDFGTGYSSLSYLRRLPVAELKLDRSFVADLDHDEAARALSNAILGIGQSLHLTVVAEGVETQSQNDQLRAQGYPVAQGYRFSRPLPPQALGAWLRGMAG